MQRRAERRPGRLSDAADDELRSDADGSDTGANGEVREIPCGTRKQYPVSMAAAYRVRRTASTAWAETTMELTTAPRRATIQALNYADLKGD